MFVAEVLIYNAFFKILQRDFKNTQNTFRDKL